MTRPRSSKLFLIPLVLPLSGTLGIEARASELVGHVYVQTNETQN